MCPTDTDRWPLLSEQKNAIAVAHCKRGKGILKINGNPVELLEPETLRHKILEPVLLVGADKFKEIDIRVRVRGGGNTSQVYGNRPAQRQQARSGILRTQRIDSGVGDQGGSCRECGGAARARASCDAQSRARTARAVRRAAARRQFCMRGSSDGLC